MSKKEEVKTISNSPIAKKRISRGLTQEQFAKEMEITPFYLSRIERGMYPGSLTLLEKMADFFGCSIDELRGREKPYSSDGLQKSVQL